ncbi:heavy metal translocating P-type ATPase [Desulfotomaculum nigrificans CO-1-SRB]|uniref:Cd(2+)-exporting ATPase n=1 Tax=Desulfotomaculum nigrificans (strain DSM 14880 / VKM B-2319 / CO-1-SRB) TaxID=868595 RepID=F6B328_DESCC|nr:heavy metal translocating P-type ATPase [Desulfotomaculum nigrificans]AEF93932.1 heavy metal translocating P-type ATPase [Desulfotomaculum nigrificans CO-1-SRB]
MSSAAFLEFRLEGLSCADCAAKLERNIAALPGVEQAKLNFAAAKLTVRGDVQASLIIDEARRDGVRAIPAHQDREADQIAFWKKHHRAIFSGLAGILVATGWLVHYALGMESWAKLLYTATIAVGGYAVGKKALVSLGRHRLDMNVLMSIAVIGAVLIGEWSEGATVAFLFSVSEALESYTMDKARNSIRNLMNLAPDTAIVIRNGQEIQLPVKDVIIGDMLVVRPGEKIAMDGIITNGHSSINQATITGESVPVDRGPGGEVYAGTINGEGSLMVRVTKLVQDNTISRIIHLVEEAQGQRAPSQAFVDRFAAVYTPVVITLAALIVVIPPLLLNQPWAPWIYRGLALLVVACPCALVISTPVAIVSAIGNAARHGVLIKGGIHLEEVSRLRALAFDKTGTLTKGLPEVTQVIPADHISESELLTIAGAVEHHSEHPLARAIVAKTRDINIYPTPAENFQALTGLGARATVNGQNILVGSPRLLEQNGINIAGWQEALASLFSLGNTVVMVAREKEVLGCIGLADRVRPMAADSVAKLSKLGISPLIMLTGDNRQTAEVIAAQAGIDDFRANLLPQDKVAEIKKMRQELGFIGMVGDGINDAPALAAANVGIAMGGAGSDAALETADLVLMGDDLSKLPFTVRMARSAMQVIKQNITFAIGIKLLAVLAVFPGWLTLWLAILADMGATIMVTLNSIRLVGIKPDGGSDFTIDPVPGCGGNKPDPATGG